MKYATVCSGIGAPEQAWADMWGHPEFVSEIDKFPSAVLKHHYPNVPNHGDMTKYKEWPDYDKLGLICGGTPCQSFSVAGLRKGMDDPRGNLTLTYLGILARYNPRWFIWENVPGVFSSVSYGQPDFGRFLSALAELGYSCAYRVLDAQYFGVPQRRRRVFVVGHLGADWRPPYAVLFEPESMRGNTPKGGKAGEGVARSLRAQPQSSHREDSDNFVIMAHGQGNAEICRDGDPSLTCNHEAPIIFEPRSQDGVPRIHKDTCPTPNTAQGGQRQPCIAIQTSHTKSNGSGINEGGPAYTLDQTGAQAVAFDGFHPDTYSKDIALTLKTDLPNAGGMKLSIGSIVRRLTPMECERLQGFPDGYTLIPGKYKYKAEIHQAIVDFLVAHFNMTEQRAISLAGHPDGHRYKALGNSMAVPVVRWIGERIQLWESLNKTP
jgi:DNA (cytosine-5)-methyltransferase 1